MANNPMADAINNVDVKNIYECVKEAEPLFDVELGTKTEYNYDNIIAEEINLTDVLVLNLFKTINSMNDKLINGRIKDKEAEKIRIDYLKTYINACNCFTTLVNKTNANTKYDKKTIQSFMDLDAILIDVNITNDESNDRVTPGDNQ